MSLYVLVKSKDSISSMMLQLRTQLECREALTDEVWGDETETEGETDG